MSAVAEAPPAAKKPKMVYGEHTRDVSLVSDRSDPQRGWRVDDEEDGRKKLTPTPALSSPDANNRKQSFLKVYERLREEIVADSFLAGQPEAAKQWVTKVSGV